MFYSQQMSKILSRVQATRMGNCKKVAQYCQKEARRAATKSGRANRDVQNKAKKAMKEVSIDKQYAVRKKEW